MGAIGQRQCEMGERRGWWGGEMEMQRERDKKKKRGNNRDKKSEE